MAEEQNATVETDLPDLEERKSGLEAALAGHTQEHRTELQEQGVIQQGGKAAELDKALKKSALERGLAGHTAEHRKELEEHGLLRDETEQQHQLGRAMAAAQVSGGLRRRSDADELKARGILLEESPATHEANRKTAAAALESALEHRPDAAEALSHDAPASSS